MSQSYVLGFAFDWNAEFVVLIEKLRPVWQAGKLNGVGGKIEMGESIYQAMVREFKEETGVDTVESDWHKFATIRGDWGHIYCFLSKLPEIHGCTTTEDEQIFIPELEEIDYDSCLPNLSWLLPMARMFAKSCRAQEIGYEIVEILPSADDVL